MEYGFDQVGFRYTDKRIAADFSLRLPRRGIVCLSGPSGCGKTTLLRLMAGLEQPESGKLIGFADKRIAVVFQENRLLPWLSVAENVAAVLTGEHIPQRTHAALEAVGLGEAADLRPAQLSGGMARRAAIARALAYDGDVLLLDEPFAGIDAQLWHAVAVQIRAAYAQRLVVLVTHVEAEAAAMGASLVRLAGPPVTVVADC